MEMLEKIIDLKNQTESANVRKLCENATAALTATIYNNVSQDAKKEIERLAVDNLFEGLSKIKDEEIQSWVENQRRVYEVHNIGVITTINKLLNENSVPNLREVLNVYKDRIKEGTHEAMLYEEFISAMNSFSYFPEVGNAIAAIGDRVTKYKNDIDITKIIETMKETKSEYLIPLIEDVINNYLNHKNEQNKSFLKETLSKFSYDPFVRDIINIVTLDSTKLQLEYANAECDIEKLYSPIIYLGENEVIFNIKGTYYNRKGNTINKFPNSDIPKLDEEFVTLCNILNSDKVEIDSAGIHVFGKKDYAQIDGKQVLVNESVFTDAEFALAKEQSKWSGNESFLYMVETLRANYDEIAELDFVKRVFLKESVDHFADVFKLRDNIFITTRDANLSKATFYRNVNPIQAKNIMIEHLNYDVSKTFSSLLPQEEKINTEINETKEEFNKYITMLEAKVSTLSSQTANDVTIEVLKVLNEELDEIKNQYKDYLNLIENYTKAPEEENIDDVSEAIKVTIEVGKKKYQIPIPTDGMNDDGEDNSSGTMVGDEDIENTAASEITFDDDESELLGDDPSIADDEIDLGVEDVEQEADDAEEEAEEAEEEEEEQDAEGDEFEDGDDSDIEGDDEAETDDDLEDEFETKKKKKKKKKKNVEESGEMKKTSFINDSADSDDSVEEDTAHLSPKAKVFLIKKKK